MRLILLQIFIVFKIWGAKFLFLRIFLSFIFIGAAGCSPNLPLPFKTTTQTTKLQNQEVKSNENIKKSIEKQPNVDFRLQKILSSPALIASQKNIEAAQQTVLIVESQTEPVVTAISNLGPKLDNEDLELEATGGLSVTRLISDGGAVNAMTGSANLNVEASKLLYKQNINNALMEVIKAEQAILNFIKIEDIYNEQLKVYNDNLPLIQTAANANIISKTDVLKLEQIKLKSEESYLTAKNGADAAKLVRKKYNLNKNQDFFKIDLENWRKIEQLLSTNNLLNLQLIKKQIDIIEKDIEAIEASYSANIAMAGTATANVTDIDNSLGFLGLNISLPVKDGGKRDFQIQEKTIQIAALKKQIEEISLVQMTSFTALQNFQMIFQKRYQLILNQIDNSKTISDDIELKLRAGAASVIDLASEKMNFYDLRSQKIALEYQNINEIINFYQALGHQCDLVNLCDQISFAANIK